MIGYILAGGRNRRMGGKKKCFLEYEGKLFYERVQEALIPYCEKIYLSVEEKKYYKETGFPMVEDLYPGIGPMGGLHAGLSQMDSPEDALFVAACDMPFFTAEAAGQIVNVYQKNKIVTLSEEQDRIHPLCGIYPGTVLPMIEKMIEEKNYRVMNLLSRISWQSVFFDEGRNYFRNINTTKEYRGL